MPIPYIRSDEEDIQYNSIIYHLFSILTYFNKDSERYKYIATAITKLIEILNNEDNEFKQLEYFQNKFKSIHNELSDLEKNTSLLSSSKIYQQKKSIIEKINKYILEFIQNSNLNNNTIQDIIKYILENSEHTNTNINIIKSNLAEQLKQLDNKIKISEKNTKKLEKELEENKKIAQSSESQNIQLQEKIKELEEETTKSKEETKKLEKATEELNKYKNETEKINKAIEKLKEPAEELKDSKKKFEENRDNYNKYAMDLFAIAKWIFILIMLNLFLFVGINDIIKSEKNLTIGFYLINIFPIIFPTVLGFLFIRQSNLNSQEVQKINKRFILIHEVNQSLQALVEVNRGKDMDNKTEKVIDRLIENILNYATEVNDLNGNKQDMNFIELNESIDKLIDTISKKVPISNE